MAALILVDGEIVLVRHRAGRNTYHLLPGGGVDYRETLEAAIVREVKEETGLDIVVGRPLILNDTIDPQGTRHVVNVTFAATVVGGALLEVSGDPRVEAIDLMPLERLRQLDLRPPFADELLDFITNENRQAVYLGSLFTSGP